MRHYKRFPWLVYIAVAIIVGIVLGEALGIPQPVIIVVLVIGGWIVASMVLWKRASVHATGDEWWQDDNCAGWRGY